MTGSPWKVRADGSAGSMIADAAEVRRALELFADPDHGLEVRAIPKGAFRVCRGSDLDGLAQAVAEMPGGIGIYFIVNPVPPGLDHPAKVGDIVSRRWLYIDVDPVKDAAQKDNPASDAEKGRTSEVCESVNEYLRERGWPAPIITDSGNGYGLFYRCNLPNDPITQATYRRLLIELAAQFNGDNGQIDKSIHNANRLAKIPGTWARKGVQTDDRPHRPCRLVYVPETIEVLTFDQLRGALAEPADDVRPATPPTTPSSSSTPTTGTRTAAYARKALDAECARVALAAAGTRNDSLNRAAFSLGQLVAGGLADLTEVDRRLHEAAIGAGLDEAEIRKTIKSGLIAGMAKPRGIPEDTPDPKVKWGKGPDAPDTPAAEPDPTTDPASEEYVPLTVSMSDVKPMTVDWLVPHRIPKRFICVFAGRTGVGKSFVSHDLIARLSRGDEIPFAGGQCFEPGGTLILSEDSHEYVLAPRLIEAGADLSRIHAMSWEAMGTYHLSNTKMLTRACDEVPGGVSLVLIDPPTNFLGDTNEHRNSEVRQLVMRVVEWALERDPPVAVVFILHVNKQGGKDIEALNRVMGSVAWVTTARIAHTLCPRPGEPDQCLWVPLKNNLGQLTKSLAYRIASRDSGRARVEWVEEVDVTADEAMAPSERATKKKPRKVVASEWLEEHFGTAERIPSEAIWKASKAAGLSRNAVLEAKDEMGIRAKEEHDGAGSKMWAWYWRAADRATWAERKPKATSTE